MFRNELLPVGSFTEMTVSNLDLKQIIYRDYRFFYASIVSQDMSSSSYELQTEVEDYDRAIGDTGIFYEIIDINTMPDERQRVSEYIPY